jgi:hypothetical protein
LEENPTLSVQETKPTEEKVKNRSRSSTNESDQSDIFRERANSTERKLEVVTRERTPSAGNEDEKYLRGINFSEPIPIEKDRRLSIESPKKERRASESKRFTDTLQRKLSSAERRHSSVDLRERSDSNARRDAEELDEYAKGNQFLISGDTFGESAFFNLTNQYSIVAAEDQTFVYRMDNMTINSLLQSDYRLCERFFQNMCLKLSVMVFKPPIRTAIAKVMSQQQVQTLCHNLTLLAILNRGYNRHCEYI